MPLTTTRLARYSLPRRQRQVEKKRGKEKSSIYVSGTEERKKRFFFSRNEPDDRGKETPSMLNTSFAGRKRDEGRHALHLRIIRGERGGTNLSPGDGGKAEAVIFVCLSKAAGKKEGKRPTGKVQRFKLRALPQIKKEKKK